MRVSAGTLGSGAPAAAAVQAGPLVVRTSADGATFGELGETLSLATAADGTAVAHLRGEVDGAVAVAAYLDDDLDDPQIGTVTVTAGGGSPARPPRP